MQRSLRCSRSPDWWVTALRVATQNSCAGQRQYKEWRGEGQGKGNAKKGIGKGKARVNKERKGRGKARALQRKEGKRARKRDGCG